MYQKNPIIVAGLGFGDEGKGTTVDALVRRHSSSTVVRYNGGAQAGHNVVTPDGRWHCFAQFGSGTLVRTSKTVLSRFMLLDLEAMVAEAEALVRHGVSSPWSRLTLDHDCLVVTPMQKFVGRMREVSRGKNAHGSCGMGVGETIIDGERLLSVRVRDLRDPRNGTRALANLLAAKVADMDAVVRSCGDAEVRALREDFLAKADVEALAYRYATILSRDGLTIDRDGRALRRALADRGVVIFEGAQGALLDRRRGFRPHVTKSDATMTNACRLLAEADRTASHRLGIIRAYGHRHGNGPFLTEDESLRPQFDDERNMTNRWQGQFRVGWIDLVALRYGIAVNGGIDALAVTGLDRLSGLKSIRVCSGYADAGGRPLGPLRRLFDGVSDERMIAQTLSKSTPIWTDFDGWSEDLGGIRRFQDLPKNAQTYIRFLESPQALNVPVESVSVGPTAAHKILLRG